MNKFLLSVAITATLASSAVFADSGSKLSAFDGIPSDVVQAKELDAVSGQGTIASKPINIVDRVIKINNNVSVASTRKVNTSNYSPISVPSGGQYALNMKNGSLYRTYNNNNNANSSRGDYLTTGKGNVLSPSQAAKLFGY